MLLLKIGSAPTSDIVLDSPYVSALNAEMLVGDDGTIMLEDKNSTNGTFVNGNRLTPNVKQPVKRGDLLKFGNVALQWHQVPVLPDPSKYKAIINIGTDLNCDVPVSNQFVSRCHAILYVDKKNKCTIYDYNSKNGTEINGNRMTHKKYIPVKRGDNITVGSADVTEELKKFIPNPFGWVKNVAIGLVAAIALFGIGVGIKPLIFPDPKPDPVPPLTEIQKSVVMVYGHYTMYVQLKDNPIQRDVWEYVMKDQRVKFDYNLLPVVESIPYTGTAFFLDRDGRMATNRHVAVPWENAAESQKKEWGSMAEQFIHEHLPTQINFAEQAAAYDASTSILWPMVKLQALREGNGSLSYVNSLIRQLQNAKYEIVGRIDYFGIAYPGRHYDNIDEFERCTLLDHSDNPDIDLALIQLNNPHTPDNITWVFDPALFKTERLMPQHEKLTWIGYPNGLAWARDTKIHELRPQVRETMCSSNPSKYDFDIQGEIVGGASGSPVFETVTGQLVGVAYARLVDGATYGRVIQAKYLKEMYEKETK